MTKREALEAPDRMEEPSKDVTCLDASEMLVDGFIRDCNLWPAPFDRDELVRRVATLLSMQREMLKRELAERLAASEELVKNLRKDLSYQLHLAKLASLQGSVPAEPQEPKAEQILRDIAICEECRTTDGICATCQLAIRAAMKEQPHE